MSESLQLPVGSETLEGLIRKAETEHITRRHHNAQRLLRPLHVINPFASHLTFPAESLRARRDHKKYLGLIKAIAFLHQYQREIKTVQHNGSALQYIEVTLDDIAKANTLASEILGRTLDELSPPSRLLLKMIRDMVEADLVELQRRIEAHRMSMDTLADAVEAEPSDAPTRGVTSEQHTGISSEQRERYLNHISQARKEYDELAKIEVQRAFVYSFEEMARTMCNNYLDNVEAFCNKERIKDPITEEEMDPDEQLMRSIEEQIVSSCQV